MGPIKLAQVTEPLSIIQKDSVLLVTSVCHVSDAGKDLPGCFISLLEKLDAVC